MGPVPGAVPLCPTMAEPPTPRPPAVFSKSLKRAERSQARAWQLYMPQTHFELLGWGGTPVVTIELQLDHKSS